MYLSKTDIAYCSVYCDHRFEFNDVPRNPYQCGNSTNFQWRDGSGRIFDELPKCTGMYYWQCVKTCVLIIVFINPRCLRTVGLRNLVCVCVRACVRACVRTCVRISVTTLAVVS